MLNDDKGMPSVIQILNYWTNNPLSTSCKVNKSSRGD